MILFVVALAGAVVARLAWSGLTSTFATPMFARQNYRGRSVPTAAGIVLVLAVVCVEAVRVVIDAAGADAAGLGRGRVATLVVASGLGLLGLFDDLAGSGEARGFRGHLGAMARGRLTTGAIKLFGGGAVAVVAVTLARPSADPHLERLLADAALVALCANLGNLLDRAPGRAIKVGVVTFAVLVAASGTRRELAGVAVVLGAAAALAVDDLHERLMLGDTGANVLGGALGLGVVLTGSPLTRVVTLAVVAAANVLSELISFSRVIDAVPPLRVLDRMGRAS